MVPPRRNRRCRGCDVTHGDNDPELSVGRYSSKISFHSSRLHLKSRRELPPPSSREQRLARTHWQERGNCGTGAVAIVASILILLRTSDAVKSNSSQDFPGPGGNPVEGFSWAPPVFRLAVPIVCEIEVSQFFGKNGHAIRRQNDDVSGMHQPLPMSRG